MLWYLGYGTRYLLMGLKLLAIDSNYQNTEFREWIVFHNDCVVTSMLGCNCIVLHIINCRNIDILTHNIDD